MTTHYQRHGKKYYEKNKAVCIERNRVQQEKYKQQWHDYKAKLACSNCGENHPATLDFHHVNRDDPNKKHVNTLIKNKCYAQAYKEIEEKCIVLCANCHRIHHYEEHKQKNTPEEKPSGAAWEEAKVKQGE